MTFATDILKRSPRKLTYPKGRNGMLAKGAPMGSIGQARSAGVNTAQQTVITFPAPGTLAVGAEVFINISEDCVPYQIRLHRCDAAATDSLSTLLMNALNGTTTAGGVVLPKELPGYSATATAVTNPPVTITGPAGKSFTVSFGSFGTTVNGIANPPVPTQALSVSASCADSIYVGTAIVNNIQAVSTARANILESVAPEWESLVMSPTNNTLERFMGWVCEDPFQEIQVADCCDELECDKPLGCHDCIHYTRTQPNTADIYLQLEDFPAGASVPASLVGMPLYYRHTLATGYTKRGTPAVQLAGASANHSLAQDKAGNFQWIVKEVVDSATRLVLAGVNN